MNTERITDGQGALETTAYVWQIALILGIAFLLGYLLRYILNDTLRKRISELEGENGKLYNASKNAEESGAQMERLEIKVGEQKAEIDRLNTRLSDCFATRMKAENALATLQTKYEAMAAPVPAVEEIISSAVEDDKLPSTSATSSDDISAINYTSSSTSTKDDLKKIEGIGPKIEQLLNADGIHTFQHVIDASAERIRGILTAAGPNYAVHDPATWAEQSALANTGQWEALGQLQEELKGGKRK